MTTWIVTLAILPIIGFFVISLMPKKEKVISLTSLGFMLTHLLLAQWIFASWVFNQFESITYQGPSLYNNDGFDFAVSFIFDKTSAVFSLVGALLTFLIVVYSRIYMHREPGYKRFFLTILLFYVGYNLIVLSGNFEVLFAGWEILGISSFLLIGFYRERYLPSKNAYKVFTIYRLGDLGIILAVWSCHLLWHKSVQFHELQSITYLTHITENSFILFLLAMGIALAASVKSAQFPFCTWMPRAMEGPTPSSAIFYGSLSVHMGVFLLLRTEPLWSHSLPAKALIFVIGLVTAFTCNGMARVQSSIKSQVAYASLCQIGIIFIEIVFGFTDFALVHFAGNAFLRTYQLLASPSVVSYLIREQFYNPKLVDNLQAPSSRLLNTYYILSLKEWNLDTLLYTRLWFLFKSMGRVFSNSIWLAWGGLAICIGLIFAKDLPAALALAPSEFTSYAMALFGVLFVLMSLTERKNNLKSWSYILLSHLIVVIAVGSYIHLTWLEISLYLSGVVSCWGIGSYILYRIQTNYLSINNSQEPRGLSTLHPSLSFVFLLCCLGLSGFPITPSFIGEDIIFHHIHKEDWLLGMLIGCIYVFDGLSIMRIYYRLFMGLPHISKKPVAYKSS